MNAINSYQFAHIEIYARKPSGLSSSSGRRTVKQILGEASRLASYCPHIKEIHAPATLEGYPIEQLEHQLEKYLQQNLAVKNVNGNAQFRQARQDTYVLLTAIYSYPEPVETYNEIVARHFFDACLVFHTNEFGAVDSAVMHLDESYPHIHVFTFTNNGKKLHPGHSAKILAIEAGVPARERAHIYKDAMRDFQTRFNREVAEQFDMERDGPKRPRINSKDYKAAKKREQISDEHERSESENKIKKSKLLKQRLEDESRAVLDRNRISDQERRYKSLIEKMEENFITIKKALTSEITDLKKENSDLLQLVAKLKITEGSEIEPKPR